MDKPNCYECKHRKDVLGDVHSRCAHPKLEGIMAHSVVQILALVSTVGRGLPIDIDVGLNIAGNPHGIKHGWFSWPFNFDPTWLETCDGWEEEE